MKSNIFSSITICIALILFATACEGPLVIPCEKGESSTITETRNIQDFKQLIIELPANIHLSQDSVFSLEIDAQENILEIIETSLTGDILEITSDRCLRNHDPITIRISMPEVTMIDVKGSGDVISQDRFTTDNLDLKIVGSGDIHLNADVQFLNARILGSGDMHIDINATDIDSKVTGSGNIELSGQSENHNIDIDGHGDVHAFDATTNQADVNIRGSGTAELFVTSTLDVKITGSGDVFYKGNPLVDADISGSGNVVDAN